MLIPVFPVPVMKNMIGYSLLGTSLFLGKFARLPGNNIDKHLFSDRVIFDHTIFPCKIIDDTKTKQ